MCLKRPLHEFEWKKGTSQAGDLVYKELRARTERQRSNEAPGTECRARTKGREEAKRPPRGRVSAGPGAARELIRGIN